MQRLFAPAALALLTAACGSLPRGYEQRAEEWDRLESHWREDRAVPVLGPEAGLREHIAHAQVHNPGLRAAFLQWKAALERVPQSTGLPDPVLSFSAAVLGNVETRNGPILGSVGLSQSFPWFGTLDAAGRAAFEAAEAARERFETRRLQIVYDLRRAWYELHYLQRAVVVTAGNLELLRHGEELARIRYETAAGPHADVIRAQVELRKLEDRLRTLKDLRRPLAARIDAAIGAPARPGPPSPGGALPAPADFDPERLRQELAATSPVLRALRREARAAEESVAVAEQGFYPDLLVGAEYTFVGSDAGPTAPDAGQDALGLRFGIGLPIWRGRTQAAVRAAEAEQHAARGSWQQARNELAAELELALYELRDAGRRLELYRHTLIPKAEESLQANLAAYQTNKGTFLDYLDSERVLLEFSLAAARAEADRAQALAAAERITGVALQREE